MNYKSFTFALLLVATVFVAPVSAYAATNCPGGGVAPDGFSCPPTYTANGPQTITTPGDPLKQWHKCLASDKGCVNGWAPYQCSSTVTSWCANLADGTGLAPAVVKTVQDVTKSPAATDIATDCKDSSLGYLDPGLGKGFCYLGGVLIHALDGIFSLDNIFWLLSVISYATFRLSGILLGLGTWWLDGAVYYTVVLMGAFISYDPSTVDGKVQGIKLAWALVRDIANIAIIAGFVAVGISTILNIAQYAADKFLARLIIAALLVNFSYFITGAVIDAANYVSVQIYYSDIMTEGCTEGSQTGTVSGVTAIGGAAIRGSICSIGSSFMKHSNLSSWDKLQGIALNSVGAGPQGTLSDTTDTSNLSALQTKDLYYWLFVLGLLGTIFNLLAGFVFIMAAGLLIIRFAALIIVLVTSPIGIAGVNVPYIDAYVGRWWSALASQAAFAPIYFILVGIGLLVMKNFADFMGTHGKSFTAALGKNATDPALGILTGNLPIFIVFFVGMAFMYLALQFAREIASSVPELKGLYEWGQSKMWNAYTGPAKLGQMGVGLALSPVRSALENAAANANPRSMTARTLTGFSSLLRGFDKIGKKQKEGAKTSAEEAEEAVKHKRNDRYAPDLNKTLGTWWQQSAFSWPFKNIIKGEPFWRKKGERTPKEDGKIKEAIHTIPKDKINETLSKEEVDQGLKHGDFTAEQQQAIFASHGYSEKDKHAFIGSFLEGKGFKVQNGKIDGKDAAERIDTLTDVEKQILYAERKELLADEAFLSNLKSKEYESIRKGESLEDRKKMDTLRMEGAEVDDGKGGKIRKGGLKAELRSGDEERTKKALKRMSDDEKANLDYETVTKALPHMSPAERNHIYRNARGEEGEKIKTLIRAKHGSEVEVGTGYKNKEDEPDKK